MKKAVLFHLHAHEGSPMASAACIGLLRVAAAVLLLAASVSSSLSPDFYSKTCPQALPVIKQVVEAAVRKEPRMGASLLRLLFHDCFVNLGGPSWDVQLGRRDSRNASKEDANKQIPGPFSNLTTLLASFQTRGMNLQDLVVLSAAHTIGQARCIVFRRRIYNEYNIDFNFARSLQPSCPSTVGDGDNNLSPLDHLSPNQFGFNYFMNLLMQKGLLHSDQELYNGGPADKLTRHYALNPTEFFRDFAASMVKMQNVSVLTGNQGEVRLNCSRVNS